MYILRRFSFNGHPQRYEFRHKLSAKLLQWVFNWFGFRNVWAVFPHRDDWPNIKELKKYKADRSRAVRLTPEPTRKELRMEEKDWAEFLGEQR